MTAVSDGWTRCRVDEAEERKRQVHDETVAFALRVLRLEMRVNESEPEITANADTQIHGHVARRVDGAGDVQKAGIYKDHENFSEDQSQIRTDKAPQREHFVLGANAVVQPG